MPSAVAFTLWGTGAGIPAGDQVRIEEAINTIPDDVALGYIVKQLDRCDVAFNQIADAGNVQVVAGELYSGDINRSVLRSQKNFQVVELYWKRYFLEVDQLARTLWCPEFRTPDSDYYRYARSGGEYVKSLPGTAGTNGDALLIVQMFA
ncbi:hypothetical protein K9N68_37130 (plasmid) [Kovacikia minuta CCNUW1]|uniref:hypothetical protein n=1 Tax=Kovacikia minuta TaxID=2931930 RepID=UPI001CCA2644|nr:hypothetical protein [Kovacikia minuta]UBF29836.1 hypothetical protein K9N68_37130 [Kovacikia minuta CCNUW1]